MKKRHFNWIASGAVSALVLLASLSAQAESVSPTSPAAKRAVPVKVASGKIFEDSRWALSYNAGEGDRQYDVQLHPGGRMLNTDPNDRTNDNDRWESKGKYVILRFNDSYAVYMGSVQNDGSLQGSATNVNGDRWNWSGRRSKGDTVSK